MDLHLSPDVRVALEGFTAFEREQLAALVQAASNDAHVFVVCEALAGANLVVANADSEPAMRALDRLGRWPCAVVLGTQPRPDAAVQLGRPLNGEALQRSLRQLVRRNPPMSDAVQRVRDELARFIARRPARRRASDGRGGRDRSDTLPLPLAD